VRYRDGSEVIYRAPADVAPAELHATGRPLAYRAKLTGRWKWTALSHSDELGRMGPESAAMLIGQLEAHHHGTAPAPYDPAPLPTSEELRARFEAERAMRPALRLVYPLPGPCEVSLPLSLPAELAAELDSVGDWQQHGPRRVAQLAGAQVARVLDLATAHGRALDVVIRPLASPVHTLRERIAADGADLADLRNEVVSEVRNRNVTDVEGHELLAAIDARQPARREKRVPRARAAKAAQS
jgi:hypothetical protein